MSTPVFDVVHMFSERGISAVPIIDENGIVINLYETVDVIVSLYVSILSMDLKLKRSYRITDPGPSWSISSPGLDDI